VKNPINPLKTILKIEKFKILVLSPEIKKFENLFCKSLASLSILEMDSQKSIGFSKQSI
jgi:hypothetical protein